jgi:hypothetical protein
VSYRSVFAFVAAVATSLSLAPRAEAVRPPIEVTACGQEIAPGRTGFLSADLDCPVAEGSIGVKLGNRAKLDLRGFVLSGGAAAVACGKVLSVGIVVVPVKGSRCEVFGGTITGARYDAVVGGNVTLRDMTVVENHVYAVLAFNKAFVFSSHIENTPNGVQANKLIEVHGSTFVNADVNSGRDALLEGSSVTGNESNGVVGSRRIKLVDSDVTGNGTQPDCGQVNHACADLLSENPPWLDGASTCGLSAKLPLPAGQLQVPWGVCTND